MTPTPRFQLEACLGKVAKILQERFEKIRVITRNNLMITVKNIMPYLPMREHYHHEIIRARETLLERCWKCKGVLERRPMGYFCPRCSRYRRRKLRVLHWKRRGGGV